MRIILSILLFTSFELFAQLPNNLPLQNSAWIVAQGNNQKIYASTLPLRPDKIAIVQIYSEKSIYVAYANLNYRTYRCSAELVDDIKKQFEKNRITVSDNDAALREIIDIKHVPFNDTVWSADAEVSKNFNKYDLIGRITASGNKLFSPGDGQVMRNVPEYFREKPVYYGTRFESPKDYNIYTIESVNDKGEKVYLKNDNNITENNANKFANRNNLASTNLKSFQIQPRFTSYRKGRTIFEEIPVEYSFKTSNIGYWQVHLYPEVWYYPRDPFSGDPIIKDELKMTQKEAFEKRKQSLKKPDDLDLKYYRNPYLSDSASVILSFAFADGGADMSKQDAIDLVDETMHLNHYPKRMYRVSTQVPPTNWIMYGEPLFKLYSKTPEEEEYFSNLSARCPSWEVADERNAEIIFPEKLQKPDRLVRNKSVDNGIFSYNGCPCSRISHLMNLTSVQLRKLIFLTPPMCDRNEMMKTIDIYDAIAPYLKNENDHNLLLQRRQFVLKIIEERDAKAKKAGVSWVDTEGRCPATWADQF